VERLSDALYQLFDLFQQNEQLSLYANEIRKFFELSTNIENKSRTGEHYLATPFSVTLSNVSFAYPNSNFSLKNINMNIQAGEKVAIVGNNGAGKSTLIKLLLRLYDVDEGVIY